MAWIQSDLDVITAAIAQGARRVRFQTHEVEYQSLSDLLRARDAIRAELGVDAENRASIVLTEYQSGY